MRFDDNVYATGTKEQSDFERSLGCYRETLDKIDRLQFDKGLYEGKCIDCLKSMQYSHVLFGPDMFYKAWLAFGGDRGVKYEDGTPFDRDAFLKVILEHVFEERHRKHANLESIVSCGYEGYAYGFRYSIYGITLEVQFPMYSLADGNNWTNLMYRCMYEESPHSWSNISYGLMSNPVFAELNKWLDKRARELRKNRGKDNG